MICRYVIVIHDLIFNFIIIFFFFFFNSRNKHRSRNQTRMVSCFQFRLNDKYLQYNDIKKKMNIFSSVQSHHEIRFLIVDKIFNLKLSLIIFIFISFNLDRRNCNVDIIFQQLVLFQRCSFKWAALEFADLTFII